jgi:hypothetical protein
MKQAKSLSILFGLQDHLLGNEGTDYDSRLASFRQTAGDADVIMPGDARRTCIRRHGVFTPARPALPNSSVRVNAKRSAIISISMGPTTPATVATITSAVIFLRFIEYKNIRVDAVKNT